MAERVLILGGAGFIGSHLARRHLATGDGVHIGVRPGWRRPQCDFLAGVAVTAVDLMKTEEVEDLFARSRPTIVYHLAAGTPHGHAEPDVFKSDVTATLDNLRRIISVARRYRPAIKSFVRAGSLAEYRNAAAPSEEQECDDPPTAYGLSLALGSRYLRFVQRQLPFPAVTARLALTYGNGQRSAFLVPSLLRSCLHGRNFHVREPSGRRDMIYVEDAVSGLIRIGQSATLAGAIINLCTGIALSNRRIAETIWSACGSDPSLLSFAPEQASPSVVWGSPVKARELLGFSARYTFSQGVAEMLRATVLESALT